MPLYEYECEACGHRFEVIHKYSDTPISVCPKCGGSVRKLFSSPAIQFKGSGFYITDYARSGRTGDASSSSPTDPGAGSGEKKSNGTGEGAGAQKSESKDSAKSESKSEGKSDSKKKSSKSSASKPASD